MRRHFRNSTLPILLHHKGTLALRPAHHRNPPVDQGSPQLPAAVDTSIGRLPPLDRTDNLSFFRGQPHILKDHFREQHALGTFAPYRTRGRRPRARDSG